MSDDEALTSLRAHLAESHSIVFDDSASTNPIPLTLSNLRWLHRRFLKSSNNPNGCDAASIEKG